MNSEQELGASRELRMLKLRHSLKDAHDATDQEIDNLYNHVIFELLSPQSKEIISK